MWARVDDGWWSHPKVLGISLAARGLWVSALSWSCHQRKDTVPTALLALFYASEAEVAELVAAGMWVPVDGGWRIHDWSEYQEKSLSEKRAEAGSKGGRRKAENQATGKQMPSKPQARALAGPSLPIPSRPEGRGDGSVATQEPAVGDEERRAQVTHIREAKAVLTERRAALEQSATAVTSEAK